MLSSLSQQKKTEWEWSLVGTRCCGIPECVMIRTNPGKGDIHKIPFGFAETPVIFIVEIEIVFLYIPSEISDRHFSINKIFALLYVIWMLLTLILYIVRPYTSSISKTPMWHANTSLIKAVYRTSVCL